MTHKRVYWVHNPCHIGYPQCFTMGDKINNGPQMDGLTT